MADPLMTGDQFETAISRCNYSQSGFSRFVGVGGRTVRSWISGEYPVPLVVVRLVSLMTKHKEKADERNSKK